MMTDMKHYLLTWYGVTDLRAALGTEEGDGPVLSALRTGDYSDVVILAYTNPGKDPNSFAGELREQWEAWAADSNPGRPALGHAKLQRIVDALSNTEAGHQHFTAWLREELSALRIEVTIQFIPKALKHLNDADGIYEAATSAVEAALGDPAEKDLTTYVSPGTPVMAYTWALIARSNPQLSIGVISSSDPRLPPERIELPKALLAPSISAPTGAGPAPREYDVVLHLLGEQTIPIFFGMRQFQGGKNIILTTKEYEPEAQRLTKVAGIEPAPVIISDPFKPAATRRAIIEQLANVAPDAEVAVNMTGGTKLMFAGALSACWELGLDPFYFEIRHHNVIFLRDGSQVPFVGISDVEDFLKAGGFTTVTKGIWPQPQQTEAARNRRAPIAQQLWKRRNDLRHLYRDKEFLFFRDQWNRHWPQNERDGLPFSFAWNGGEASLDKRGTARLVLLGTTFDVPKKGFFPFLAGGWLEEYVYALLRPLQDEGTIRDVRVGFEAGYRDGSTDKKQHLAQEFDCTFTDGKRLWIVECKAGPVKQEAIQKLENNLKLYGGVAARGLLVSSFPLTDANNSRIDTLPAITAVHPDHLTTHMLRIIIQTA